jgi:hypothetical protein
MEMSVQLFAPAALTHNKQPAVADISMPYENSVCRVKQIDLCCLGK